jgi:hypothetical protein
MTDEDQRAYKAYKRGRKVGALLVDLENRFTYHPPTEQQIEIYATIRQAALEKAHMLASWLPSCRETSLALTHLEEMVFWADAAIARHGLRPEATG